MTSPRISAESKARLSSFANRVRRNLASASSISEMDGDNLRQTSTPVATDDLLSCSICLERYQDTESSGRQPKILPCFHTFCRRCLDQMVVQQKTQASIRTVPANVPIRAIITCPQCRRLIAIPNGGPAAFQTNFYILQMNDLMREVNRGASSAFAWPDESFENGHISQVMATSSPSLPPAEETCAKHSNWPLLFYCRKCSQRICSNCTVLDHKENDGHVIVDVQEVMDDALKEVTEKVAWAENIVLSSKQLIQKGQSELGQMNIAEDTVCFKLNKIGESVAKALSARLRQVQDDVRNEMMNRRQSVRKETCDLIDAARNLEKKRREINDKVNARSASWILEGKAEIALEEINIMGKALQETNLEPRHFLLFDGNALSEAEVQAMCERLIPSPQRRLLPARLEMQTTQATAGQHSYISTSLKNADGKDISSYEYPLNVTVIDPEGEAITLAKTDFKNESTSYNTTFLASQFGEYGVQAELNGFPVDSCSIRFSAKANEPTEIIGERGADDGKFNKPVSVHVSSEDQALLVAEFENQRIQLFDPKTLSFKWKFSVAGDGHNYPGSIAIFNAGSFREVICPKVTIADEGRLSADTIQIFDMNSGKYVTSFQNRVLRKALHVSVNSCGRIIVSDRDANGLFVFNREGALLGRIGRQGSGPGQFNCPVFVACGLNDDILVADSANNRVQILDRIGVFKTEIGATGRGRLGAPAGITVDSFGNILVADSQKNCVQMYTKDGQYLASLQPRENALNRPRGVAAWATDGTKRLFVIDRGNHSVKTLSYM